MADIVKKQLLVLICVLWIAACAEKNDSFFELGNVRSCDAAIATCEFVNEQFILKLKLGPGVKPLQPFSAMLEISSMDSNVNHDEVSADFRMSGMDMGMNRYRFVRQGNIYVLTATLPVCTASRADWIAFVEFTSQGRHYRVGFPFHSDVN